MTAAVALAPTLHPPLARPRPGVAVEALPSPVTRRPAIGPRPAHELYRGTRGLAFVLLGFAGLGVVSLGALTSQIVDAVATRGTAVGPGEAVLLGVLLRIAPFVMLYGLAQLFAAWAVLRDKRHALPVGLLMAVAGFVISVVAIALVTAGAAPTLTDAAAAGTSTDIRGLFGWTLVLDALAALAIDRIVRGRAR